MAAICRYVARQRNSYNPAGLAVFLTRTGFGKTLLRPKPTTRAGHADRRLSGPGSIVMASGESDPLGAVAGTPHPLDALWNQAQAQRAQQLPTSEFLTWVQEPQLLALDERAVIGVPNIFACEQVQAAYAQQMGDVLTKLTGKQAVVEVVIDGSI